MRDVQDLMKKFVKIIEKYPEVYDNSLDGYRSQQAEWAWDKIVRQVKDHLKEECTVEELKAKWKGIRSSYNRYKNKLSMNTVVCKKYYLYDYLHFLDPFIKPRGLISHEKINKKRESSFSFEDGNNDAESLNDRDPLDDWEVDVKHNFTQNVETEYKADIDIEAASAIRQSKNVVNGKSMTFDGSCKYVTNNESELFNQCNSDWESDVKPSYSQKEHEEHLAEASTPRNSSRRNNNTKRVKSTEDNTTDINEDLQFFKSILSDIKNFTTKEKRKLKMGILQLIDDVENERKRTRINE